jgi:uncharacterized protein
MRIRRHLILAILLPAFLFARCNTSDTQEGEHMSIQLISPSGKSVTLTVSIAADDAAWRRGLQGRRSLAMDEGMLFVFPDDQVREFWMKDVLIPLEILFFDEEGKVFHLGSLEPCEVPGEASQSSCPILRSSGPARFVLEVPAGFIEAHQITERWRLSGSFPSPASP